jgi:hypothetical protein
MRVIQFCFIFTITVFQTNKLYWLYSKEIVPLRQKKPALSTITLKMSFHQKFYTRKCCNFFLNVELPQVILVGQVRQVRKVRQFRQVRHVRQVLKILDGDQLS